jgi:hypothetical protein
MVRTDRVALLVLLLVILFSGATIAFQAYEIDPRALGRGTAYTAVADGPLAPLWNPGGAMAAPGVHGAFAVGISPDGAATLLLGASIAAANSPTVIWNMVQSGDTGEILGTFAFPLFPQTGLGCGVSYRFSDAPGGISVGGISFHVGFRHCGPQWALGVSLSHLGAGIFGADLPLSLRAGGALTTIPGVALTIDFDLLSDGGKVAIGGSAQAWVVEIRWGTAILLAGGIDRLGLGAGFTLFGLPIDLAIGVAGSDLSPYASLGVQACIPAWW